MGNNSKAQRQPPKKSSTKIQGCAEASISPDILTILDALPFYVMLIDASHHILMVNKAVKTDLGLEPEQIIGQYCPEVVHGVNHYPGCPLDESLKTSRVSEKELFDEKQGRWLRSAIYPTELQKSDGQKIYFHLVQDINERKKTELALQRSEKRYRTLFEGAIDAIFILEAEGDKVGQIVAANKVAAEMHGYTADELLTLKITDLDTPDAAKEAPGKISRILKGEQIRAEITHQRKDGTAFPVEINAGLLELEEHKYILAIDRDITERKQAEERIRRGSDIQKVVNALLGISLLDISLEEQLELALQKIISIPWLSVEPRGAIFLVEDNSDVLVMKVQRNLAKSLISACSKIPFGKCHCGRAAASGEIEFTDCLTEHHEVLYEGIMPHGHYCVPIKYGNEVLGVINLYLKEGHRQDKEEEEFLHAAANTLAGIIKRKQNEEELGRYRQHLEELVQKRTVDLTKTNEKLQSEIGRCMLMEETVKESYKKEKKLRHELEEQIQRRADFTRALVHELKTPLTPVLAASDILAAKLNWEPWKSLARNINIGANDLNRRTDELFDIARGETGVLSLECHSLELHQLLSDIVDYVTPEANQRGISLKLRVTSSLPSVVADEDRLRQMILLLLSNALKFTPHGGDVIVSARRKGSFVAIEVRDSGPGIAREEQKWLFEPYYRLKKDKEHLGGLGLGLALLKMLAELHNGEVWVKSQKDKGATFGFSIPLEG
jgi:PAS domain S-box-containing protein